MKSKRIQISESHYNESISKYVTEAFVRNEISSFGENINQFEASIKSFCIQIKKS